MRSSSRPNPDVVLWVKVMALAILAVYRAAAMAVLATGTLFLASASSAWAAAGDLDPTFDRDGKVTTPIFTQAGDSATVYAIAVQPDGKIVAAGSAARSPQAGASTGSEFALARYNADGSLDTSFSGDGKLTKDIAGGQDYAYGVVVQPDGKIVAVGSAEVNAASFYTRFTVVRFNPDGSLDNGFGTAGVVSTDFFGTENAATSVALQADGRIVVAGSAHDGVGRRFALARYNVDGSLDASFGTGGKVTTSFFGFDDAATGVVVQADGRIVAGGRAYPGGANNQFALARYDANGNLDASFGSGGKVITDFFGKNDAALSLLLQVDGKIVAGGLALPAGFGTDQYALARYNPDGSLDTGFGADGRTTLAFSSGYQRRPVAALAPDGKIAMVSWGVTASGFDEFSLARFNSDGSLDLGFGQGGKVTTNVLGSQNQAYALAVQADGKIVAAGSAFDPSRSYGVFALTRYDAGAGSSPAALASLLVNPSSVAGGTSSAGIVTLSAAAPAGGALVTLADNSPAATVPASVRVPEGATTATFSVTTTQVAASTNATLTGTYNGLSRAATLTITAASAPPPPPPPAQPTLSSLVVNPTSVTGGSTSVATVTLSSAAPAGGAAVTLADNSPATVVPASVTVPAGATAAAVTITTSTVAAPAVSTITGAYGGTTRTAALTVNPAPAGVTLTVRATGRSGESVVSSPAGINAKVGTTASASFAVNTAITLRASNNRDAIWSGSCSSGGNKTKSCTFTINANSSVTGDVR